MQYGVTSRLVITRNRFGEFARSMDAVSRATADSIADRGVSIAQRLAPVRTGRLRSSIRKVKYSGNAARWGAFTSYAAAQEFGARPHPLPGNVRFYWQNEGRMWNPGSNTIRHPGNPAVHFIRYSYEIASREAMGILRQEYARRRV